MSDYNMSAKITGNSKGYVSAVDKAQKATKKLSASVSDIIKGLGSNGLVGALGAVGLASQGLSATLGTVAKVVQKVSKSINEWTETYKVQLIAERQLDSAIKNSPLVDGTSSKALKDFASEIQSVSNYGDEQLIPMIADLIAKGRTEAEAMKIVSTAVDMSANGTVSLETAISQLNMTMNGSIGRLGMQNKELKDLTKEELESGRAVDILADKFKGLAKATVDTSKQLQNVKGDFKEALGEFTLPSSDVWNNFWKGFYERGTIVLKRINDSVQLKTDYKATQEFVNAYAEAFKRMKPVKRSAEWAKITAGLDDDNVKYMTQALQTQLQKQGGLKTLEREFLEALENEVLLRREAEIEVEKTKETTSQNLTDEENIVALKEKYLKAIAEQEAKWANIQKVTNESVKAEERLKFYQEQLVAIMSESGGKISENNQYYKDQMAIINGIMSEITEGTYSSNEWADKLLSQRIEMLEAERDMTIENAESTGEETYTIWRYYNERILELKLEQLSREREEALAEENLTGEEKNNINEYYANEEKKIYNELGKYKKKKNKEQEKDSKSSLNLILYATKSFARKVSKMFSDIARTVKSAFSKISSFVKSVFSSSKTIFTKLFEFNIDDALDSLLAIEDAVLTFFVETLPKLPAFVKTVLKSINVMLKTLINSVKKENIATVLFDALDSLTEELPDLMQSISTIIQSTTEFMTENLSTLIYDFLTVLGENVPQVINDLLDLLSTTISEAVEGLLKWLDEGGLQIIFQMLLDMQTKIQDLVLDLLSQIATFLTEHTEDIGAFLADSLTSAFEMLPELIDSILKIITALIQAIADAFKDKEMIQAMVDGLVGGIEAILDNLGDIVSAVIDLIFSVITAIVPKLPEIILKIIGAIAKALPDLVSDIAGALGDGIKSIFKSIFNKDFWVDVFNSLREVLTNIVQAVFGGIGKLFDITDTTSSGKKKSKAEKGWDIGLGIATGGVYNLGKGIGKLLHWWADGTDNAPAGLSVVGEAGPELVNFKGGEQVFNAQDTKRILSGANGNTNNFNVTFNNLQDTTAFAMLQQLKQYNRQMAINGII